MSSANPQHPRQIIFNCLLSHMMLPNIADRELLRLTFFAISFRRLIEVSSLSAKFPASVQRRSSG
jgi:hypothetical protein